MSDIAERLRLEALRSRAESSDREADFFSEAADEIERLRELLSDLLGCAESECLSGSSYEPIQAARAALKDYQS